VLEFLNLQENSGSSSETFNVLLEVVSDSTSSIGKPIINVTAEIVSEKTHRADPLSIISRKDSDTAINIELPLLKGDYYINITSDTPTTISAILAKESLVHLKPEQYLLMTTPHTY
jgi:hypothetical protein